MLWSMDSRLEGFRSCGALDSLPHSVWDLSSQIRDQTYVFSIDRQILNHWTTQEVPCPCFLSLFLWLTGLGHLGWVVLWLTLILHLRFSQFKDDCPLVSLLFSILSCEALGMGRRVFPSLRIQAPQCSATRALEMDQVGKGVGRAVGCCDWALIALTYTLQLPGAASPGAQRGYQQSRDADPSSNPSLPRATLGALEKIAELGVGICQRNGMKQSGSHGSPCVWLAHSRASAGEGFCRWGPWSPRLWAEAGPGLAH